MGTLFFRSYHSILFYFACVWCSRIVPVSWRASEKERKRERQCDHWYASRFLHMIYWFSVILNCLFDLYQHTKRHSMWPNRWASSSNERPRETGNWWCLISFKMLLFFLLHGSFAGFAKVFYLLWFCHYKFDQNVFVFQGILHHHFSISTSRFSLSFSFSSLDHIFVRFAYGFIYTIGRFAYKVYTHNTYVNVKKISMYSHKLHTKRKIQE